MHLNPIIAAQLQALNNPSLPGIDLSLVRMQALLAALGNPEQRLPPVIHVAGTNGKGSTIAFLKAFYEAAGWRAHVYTSPHLVRFNERIVIAGSEISDDYLTQLLARIMIHTAEIPVTFFEATTAAAFIAFAEHSADIVLLETGLGGRLDATNVVAKPIATIITPIDYDHMEFLGQTLAEIATEKAGIMKPSVPCFIAEQKPEAREVLKRVARQRKAPVYLYGREWGFSSTEEIIEVQAGVNTWQLPLPSLVGAHQHQNLALASVAARTLQPERMSEAVMAKAAQHTIWPARLQKLNHGPLVDAWDPRGDVYLDGGHNAHAAQILASWAASQQKPLTLMLGMMKRKDIRAFLMPLLPHVSAVVAVGIPGEECHAPEEIEAIARACGVNNCSHAKNPADALSLLPQHHEATLLIAGSLFLAGEILKNHS